MTHEDISNNKIKILQKEKLLETAVLGRQASWTPTTSRLPVCNVIWAFWSEANV